MEEMMSFESLPAIAEISEAVSSDLTALLPSELASILRSAAAQPSAPPTGNSELLDHAYGEYAKRRSAGEQVDLDAFCEGYPSIKSALGKLLEAHRFLENNPELMRNPRLPSWPEPETMFLGFQLLRELGRGAFSRVFLATEPALGNRLVVVKVSTRGVAEAQTLGRINHLNIVPVHSVKEDCVEGLSAVCMPYLGETTLCDVMQDEKAILGRHTSKYIDSVRQIAAQLADALHFIHQRKICHRDLKPSNVLITPEGRPMLLDFNLSADELAADTPIGGTLPYMSPEQLRNTDPELAAPASKVEGLSDVFSLGVVLFELLTGKHPFGPLTPEWSTKEARLRLLQRQEKGPASLREFNPNVDRKLAGLVEQCLAFDVKSRPQSAADLAADLRGSTSPLRKGSQFLGRHRSLMTCAAVVILTLCATGTAWWSRPDTNHWLEGREAYQECKYKAAADHFKAVLDAEPGRRDVLLARARSYVKLGETDKDSFNLAFADLQSAEALEPSGELSAAFCYCVVRMGGLTDLALFKANESVERGFATAEAHNNLAYCFMLKSNKLDQAEACLAKALAINSKLQAAYHNRGLLRLQQACAAPMGVKPVQQFNVLPTADQKDLHCRALLAQAKADLGEALEIGPATMELCRDLARLHAFSAHLPAPMQPGTPIDVASALKYLRFAVENGYDPKLVAEDGAFRILRDDPRFQALCEARPGTKQMPPTVRLVNPLLD
jgi:serine/threonine protein kinase/tetratricopeptide (TPR) repeat protein